jgi:hypothetical protein
VRCAILDKSDGAAPPCVGADIHWRSIWRRAAWIAARYRGGVNTRTIGPTTRGERSSDVMSAAPSFTKP